MKNNPLLLRQFWIKQRRHSETIYFPEKKSATSVVSRIVRLLGGPADDAVCKVIGWGHRVPPAGLPIEQVLGE